MNTKVFKILPLEEVLIPAAFGVKRMQIEARNRNWYVKVCASKRIQLFVRSITCAYCGRMGSHFRLETAGNQTNPHLNLYTEDGILMTVDHIIPVALGGRNHLTNYQAMCSRCNNKRGASLLKEIAELAKLLVVVQKQELNYQFLDQELGAPGQAKKTFDLAANLLAGNSLKFAIEKKWQ